MKSSHFALIIVIILLVTAGAYTYTRIRSTQQPAPVSAVSAQYSCAQGALAVVFSNAQAIITLPNKMVLTLPRAVSGSGFRYENGTDSFSGKGSDATLTQNGVVTFSNCLAGTNTTTGTAGDTNAGMKAFTDSSKTFSFSYPGMFAVTGSGAGYTTDWSSGSSALGLVLARIDIPQSFEPKTNFGDARFIVGTSADPAAVKACLTQGNGNPSSITQVTINGTPFARVTFSDAAAGNRYDTTSYRTVRNKQCYAVEYTIHYGNIQNYPAGQVAEFDEAKVRGMLDSIVQSFRFL